MKHKPAILVVVLLGGSAGCNSLSAEILDIQEAAPMTRDGALAGVAFDCVIRTTSADEEQLVYRVNVLNARGRPIRSYNRLFSDARGNVAAQRTFMVGTTSTEEHRLRVTIPIEELEVTPGDLPFGALYGVYRANDERLFAVRRQVRLPARARAALDQHLEQRFSLPAPGLDETGNTPPPPPEYERVGPPPPPPPPDGFSNQSQPPPGALPLMELIVRRF